jgi:hypothetical protein
LRNLTLKSYELHSDYKENDIILIEEIIDSNKWAIIENLIEELYEFSNNLSGRYYLWLSTEDNEDPWLLLF